RQADKSHRPGQGRTPGTFHRSNLTGGTGDERRGETQGGDEQTQGRNAGEGRPPIPPRSASPATRRRDPGRTTPEGRTPPAPGRPGGGRPGAPSSLRPLGTLFPMASNTPRRPAAGNARGGNPDMICGASVAKRPASWTTTPSTK